ncbi:MAG TPA: methenyltetrahydromethanopterin cyclohydrolase [Geminicoccaceae bacterium]|nr:methenyltetrahydromethanopterin cyclohydrolase [Geminicoccaceae bacterium]
MAEKGESSEAPGAGWPSVGRLALPLVRRLIQDAALLGLAVGRSAAGATVVDAGIAARGGLEAGRRIAEVCLGGAGRVTLAGGSPFADWPFEVAVSTAQPVLACLASQYAGWQLSHEEGNSSWFAMASGPGRARAAAEELFTELGYRDDAEAACFVLETDRPPPEGLIRRVALDCRLPPEELTFVLTPTSSLAGTVQITARVLEVALHKLHALHFPLGRVRDGLGRAPLPPPAPDFIAAMGRTNDAILFGGEVQLHVAGPEDEAEALARSLPSSASRDYGRPFAEIFAAAGGDFYAIDSMLFSPARVAVTALATGRTFMGGRLDPELLRRSFGGAVDA